MNYSSEDMNNILLPDIDDALMAWLLNDERCSEFSNKTIPVQLITNWLVIDSIQDYEKYRTSFKCILGGILSENLAEFDYWCINQLIQNNV